MQPVVVGIAGGTASGKSTLAAELARHLGSQAQLLLHDRYYKPLPAEFRANPVSYNFDAPEALDTARFVRDLDVLREGRGTSVPQYDFASHDRRPDEEWLEPRPLLIVEGILVLADDELRKRFDHALFVHTPDDLRLIRRIRRDTHERGRTTEDVLSQYERTVRPMHMLHVEPSRAHAEQELDGTSSIQALVHRVLALPRVAAALGAVA